MKTIYTTLFCILILVSCKQEDSLYSCDPVLNEYVSTHKDALAILTIKDLTSADLQFQQAVFRSYSFGKKREIWIQKIQSLLENEPYTEAEYIHVSRLLNHLSLDYFAKESLDSNAGERASFASGWISFAKKDLKWTDKQIAFVVYRLYTSQSQFELELNALNSIQQLATVNSEESSCSCNSSSDYCSNNLGCHSGNCQITSGCGWLWSGDCNGRCY